MDSKQMLQDMLMAQETGNLQKATHSLADDMVVQTDKRIADNPAIFDNG